MEKRTRTSLGLLGASAALLVALATHEGYSDKAIVPVPGDRPTVGFGSTFRDDGSPVQMGDSTTPVKALQRSLAHLQKDEAGVKRCITVPLYQSEYDAYLSLAYNIGVPAFCKSTLVKKLNAGDYSGACQEVLKWDKFRGAPLRGLTIRRKKEYEQCVSQH